MKRAILVLVVLVVVADLMYAFDLDLRSVRDMYNENAIGTLKKFVHEELIALMNWTDKHYNILEIGAGDGRSTATILDYLDRNGINYTYTICEISSKYQEPLLRVANHPRVKCLVIDSWEHISALGDAPYDVIVTTTASSITDSNYQTFRGLGNSDTVILFIRYNPLKNYEGRFTILKKRCLSLSLRGFSAKFAN